MLAYGYEQPVVFTPQLIFDLQSANAVLQAMDLYGAILKNNYDQAKNDYKDFVKQYGDFYSPIEADNRRFYNATIGEANKLINQYGSNLYRSPEGLAAIEQMIRNVNLADVAKMKASAKNAEIYLARRGELLAKGLYDDDLERFRLGEDNDISQWDSTKNGVWLELSPVARQDLNQLTAHYYDALTRDQYLGPSSIPGYKKVGVNPQEELNLTNQVASDLSKTVYGLYQLNKIKDLIKSDNPYIHYSEHQLETEAMNKFKDAIRNANYEKLLPKDELDQYALAMDKIEHTGMYRKPGNGSRNGGGNGTKQPDYWSPSQDIYDTFLDNLTGGTAADIQDFATYIRDPKRTKNGWLNASVTDVPSPIVAASLPGRVDKNTGRYKFTGTEIIRRYNGTLQTSSHAAELRDNDKTGGVGWVATGRVKGVLHNGVIQLCAELRSVNLDKSGENTYTPRTIFVNTNIRSNNVSSDKPLKIASSAGTRIYDRHVSKQLGVGTDNKTHIDTNDDGDFYLIDNENYE